MRCEAYKDGAHHIDAKDGVYDRLACGVVARCKCGERFMVLSDEAKHDTPSLLNYKN